MWLVDNYADTAALPRWVAQSLLLRLGTVDGAPETEFGSIGTAARLSNGTVVVGDNQARELRFFSAAGEHLRSIGRNGQGPGEFRQIYSLDVFGNDSIVVWDTFLQRATVLAADGSVARVVRLHSDPRPERNRSATDFRPVFPSDDGGWLSVAHVSAPPPMRISSPTIRKDTLIVLVHDEVGRYRNRIAAAVHELLLVPGPIRHANQMGNARAMIPHGALHSYVALTQSAAYVATSDRFRIDVYGLDGSLQRVIRYSSLEETYESDEFTARRERAFAAARDEERRRALEHIFDPAYKPLTRPTLSDLRVDAAGYIWVREWGAPAAAMSRWIVFDPEGQAIAVAEVPGSMSITALSREAAVLVRRDSLDVEYVEVRAWTFR